MKLSAFLTQHMESILVEWESFARTLKPAANDMSALALRDHAKLILTAVARDMDIDESEAEQYLKSRGLAPAAVGKESAASTHGTLRQLSGFSLLQLTAEFRALRATVLRLWLPTVETVSERSTYEMVRFNETIDQALAESVVTYSEKAANTRDTFLAILGHDLRSPLATIAMAANLIGRDDMDAAGLKLAGRSLQRSARTMTAMVNDLLEYSRTQLDVHIPITPLPTQVAPVCEAALADARATYPDCEFALRATAGLCADIDANRFQQVLTNLLNNAAQHHTAGTSVILHAHADPASGAPCFTVENIGKVIPAESLRSIFAPLVQLEADAASGARSGNMGLGLFIAKEITEAHGGTIEAVSSTQVGTRFIIKLPLAHTP